VSEVLVLNILMLTTKDDERAFRNKEEHTAEKLIALMRRPGFDTR
jgi:hypothetical protein